METKAIRGEVEVIVFPYPIQGHLNPMLQFSKQLASRGLKVTFVTTSSISSKLNGFKSISITIETISDGNHGTPATASNIGSHIASFNTIAPQNLTQLIEKKIERGCNVRCLIYASIIPWALDIAKKFGIYGASFFTQSCLVNLIYYQVYNGNLSAPVEGPITCFTGMPLIEERDLPSFVREVGVDPSLEKRVLNQFSNYGDADWRFFNTFDALESKVASWISNQFPIKMIGPCIPSTYLDKNNPEDKDYGLSLFKPQSDACLQWLDARDTGSVVYISMGSLASLSDEQMEEIAKGLNQTNKYFLWVVRASEQYKIPLSFKHTMSKKGLIVDWCPQLQVLTHHALGCFVTHCGWNSTLEAISIGVPTVAFPQWTDQPTNAKCIVDFWKIGVRVKLNDDGFLNANEIELCIKEVMDGVRAKEFKYNASNWKLLAQQTFEQGGTSDRNINEFVEKLLHQH